MADLSLAAATAAPELSPTSGGIVTVKEGKTKRNRKGTDTNKLPAASGAFALPPPTPQYYEENGLRKCKPYMFAFQSFAKERWQGRTLIDV